MNNAKPEENQNVFFRFLTTEQNTVYPSSALYPVPLVK